jgi:hypothetical protein
MAKSMYKIRTATQGDAADIARLSSQLGYPSTVSETRERLASILASEDHTVYVAWASRYLKSKGYLTKRW